MASEDSEQRRKILDAAVGVFAEHGLRGATTRLLGRAAGVNSALIYYYFESKTLLFEEAIRFVVSGFLEHLRQSLRPLRGARDRVTYLVDGIFTYYRGHPDRMLLMQQALIRHPELMGRVLKSYLKEGLPSPIRILSEGMEKGELRKDHPVHAWWSVLSLGILSLNLVRLWSFIGTAPRGLPAPRIEDRRDHVVGLLLHGMAGEGSRRKRT